MTKSETIKIMAILTAAYPRFYEKQTEADKLAAIELWHRHFADVPYNIVLQAVDAVIATSKFVPNIAEINEKIDLILRNGTDEMSEAEAWSCVSHAIKNSTYNYESEFAKLPQIIRKIVHSPYQLHEWAAMDEETVQSVVASNVQRAYRTESEKQKQISYLPQERQKRLQERIKYIDERSVCNDGR